MKRILRILFRLRARILTLFALCVAAAVIALANLSFDEPPAVFDLVQRRSYGWPIIWHRIVLHGAQFSDQRTIGWYYSVPRLVANVAIWLLLLATLVGTCEWLLRRYWPRPRWSLRTLLVVVGLLSAGFGWFAKVRNRAAIQDPIISSTHGTYFFAQMVSVERSGPKWLDLLGMDRYRRRIVFANYWIFNFAAPHDEQLFLQLSRLPDLRHFELRVDELTPRTATALGSIQELETLGMRLDRLTPSLAVALSDLRQLRRLSIAYYGDTADNDGRISHECLAAIGAMANLETLDISYLPLRGASLACLARLKNLKSLRVSFQTGDSNYSGIRRSHVDDCLQAIATLTQLEWLALENLPISNESLACLAELTNVKTLSFGNLATEARPMLSHLRAIPHLKALDLSSSNIDDEDLRHLDVLPQLKAIRLGNLSPSTSQLFTPAGIADLAAIDSLEEVQLDGDVESPEAIEALLAVKGLKRLHLRGNPYASGKRSGKLKLDDGKEIDVQDLGRFKSSLAALRMRKTGIIVDSDGLQVFERYWDDGVPEIGYDMAPERPSTWLPGGDMEWMTASELADFEKAGGRANFSGATWRGEGDRLITVQF